MNRRDHTTTRQQAGGNDGPRQSGQWQMEPGRQAGGDWGFDDGQAGGWPSDNGAMGAGGHAGQDRDDNGYSARQRDYRGDSRQNGQGGDQPSRGYGDRYFNAGTTQDHAPFTGSDFGGRDFSARTGAGGRGFGSSDSYRASGGIARGDWSTGDDFGDWREYGQRRGFFERAGDEVASWFGDEDAARRRQMDHRGRGPSDYTRSDERIREDVNDCLTHDWRIDASDIKVSVSQGEVTLDGHVVNREAKRRAEDVADDVSGVRHVQNNLRVEPTASGTTQNASAPATGTGTTASTAAGRSN